MVVNKGRLTVFNPSNDTSASTTLILTYSDFQHPGDLIVGGPSTLAAELSAYRAPILTPMYSLVV